MRDFSLNVFSFTENSDGGNETLTIASSVTDNSIPFSIALG